MFSYWPPRHRLTRHQYYLQLRKDILEDRLYCNEETGLFLVALALQAEFGDYMPEVLKKATKQHQYFFACPFIGASGFLVLIFFQLYGKNYYQPEHYVSKRMLEKLALPTIKEELPRLHASHAQMLPEEAETEYLKVSTQASNLEILLLQPCFICCIKFRQSERESVSSH